MTIITQNIVFKKNASSLDNPQKNSHQCTNSEPQLLAKPKTEKPNFSLMNMIEGTKKAVAAEPMKSSRVRENLRK